jgi:hypothetical protein
MKYGIILLIVILSIRPLIPILDYGVNYDYISTVLCVNKDKPEMHCNGKCHLAKELAEKSAEEHQENTTNNPVKLIDIFIILEKFSFIPENPVLLPVNHTFFYKNLYSYIPCNSLLKPPVV